METLLQRVRLDNADQGDGLTSGVDLVCLQPGCYVFDITPGDDSDDIGWYLEDVVGNFYGTGVDEVSSFGIDLGETGSCTFLGCTDPFCLNYNPSATDDDGSLRVPSGQQLCLQCPSGAVWRTDCGYVDLCRGR